MRPLRWITIPLWLGGCEAPEDVSMPLHLEDIDGELADEAMAVWDVGWEESDSRWGAVTVEGRTAVELEGRRLCGKAYDSFGCAPNVVVRFDAEAPCLAHEVGHAAGLEHSDDPANVMYPRTGRDTLDFTEEQREAVRTKAHRLALCP